MNLCKYKNLFGKPGEGLHSIRVFDIAVVDLIMTIIASILLADQFSYSRLTVFAGLMILSVILHLMFCVDTTIIRLLLNLLRN